MSVRQKLKAFALSWQFVTMALTSLALSIASGWTTWDGVTHFTSDPRLSFLITFGIQGVMLVSAWLVVGRPSQIPVAPNMALTDQIQPFQSAPQNVHAIYVSRGRQLALWLMFAVSMTASVFFSFDSLFDKVFTQADRTLSGEIRTHSLVAEVLADQNAELERIEAGATAAVFQSSSWREFASGIDHLIRRAETRARELSGERDGASTRRETESSDVIAARAANRTRQRTRRKRLARHAEASKRVLRDLQAAEQNLRGWVQRTASDRERLIVEIADAERERRGVGKTMRAGRGPQYAILKAKATATQIQIEAAEQQIERFREAVERERTRLQKLHEAVAVEQAAVARLERDDQVLAARLAKLQNSENANGDPAADLQSSVAALKLARVQFRGAPSAQTRAAYEKHCRTLESDMRSTSSEPGDTHETACRTEDIGAVLETALAAVARRERYVEACGKARQLDGNRNDEVVAFGQMCVMRAGLPREKAAQNRALLRRAATERDDVAHRFIVSWNAFLDRNPLAFLALAMALTIDGLVFASSFCGSRSLAATQSKKRPEPINATLEGDDADLAERLVKATLGASPPATVKQLLATAEAHRLGHVEDAIFRLKGVKADHRKELSAVLGAGQAVGLVHRKGPGDTYHFSPRFLRCLSNSLEGESAGLPTDRHKSDEQSLLALAARLSPDDMVSVLLAISHPLRGEPHNHLPDRGVVYRVDVSTLDAACRKRARALLNGGSADGCSVPVDSKDDTYLVGPEFFLRVAGPFNARPSKGATRQARLGDAARFAVRNGCRTASMQQTSDATTAERSRTGEVQAPKPDFRKPSDDEPPKDRAPKVHADDGTALRRRCRGERIRRVGLSPAARPIRGPASARATISNQSSVRGHGCNTTQLSALPSRPSGTPLSILRDRDVAADDHAAIIETSGATSSDERAMRALAALAKLDRELDTKLLSLADTCRNTHRDQIEIATTHRDASCSHDLTILPGTQPCDAADTLAGTNFNQIFLAHYGLDAAREWLTAFVEKRELLADFQVPITGNQLRTEIIVPLALDLGTASAARNDPRWMRLLDRIHDLSESTIKSETVLPEELMP